MKILLLLIISPILGVIGVKLTKLTKIPYMLVLIVAGILLGVSSPINLFGNDFIKDSMTFYGGYISIIIIFLMAGYSLDLEQMQAKRGLTLKIGFLPIYISGIIAVFFGLAIINLLGNPVASATVDGRIDFYGMLILTLTFAFSAPVIMVPTIAGLKKDSPNGVTMSTLMGFILDNYTVIPAIFGLAAIGIFAAQGKTLNSSVLVEIVVVIVIGVILSFIVGVIVSYVLSKILNLLKIEKKAKESKVNSYLLITYLILGVIIAILLSGPLKSFAIVIAVGAGIGYKKFLPEELQPDIKGLFQQVNVLFALPILLTSIGGKTVVADLIKPKTILFVIIMYIVSYIVKVVVLAFILKREKYSMKEIKMASIYCLMYGSGAINVSVIIAPLADKMNQPSIPALMINYGIICYAISIPVTAYLYNRYSDQLLSE